MCDVNNSKKIEHFANTPKIAANLRANKGIRKHAVNSVHYLNFPSMMPANWLIFSLFHTD